MATRRPSDRQTRAAAAASAPGRASPSRSASAQASTAAPAEVKVQPAKGRPLLTWVGKQPLTRLPAYPAQHIETFDPAGTLRKPPADPDVWRDWPADYPRGGLLFHGDNKDVLAHLLANGFRGKARLIYIDPPFDSGADYVRKVRLRSGEFEDDLEGEGYSLGEQIQYTDIWASDTYLQFMYERLILLRELLAQDGTIYVHLDYRRIHHVRALLDEVFGPDGFRNEIIWAYRGKGLTNEKSRFAPYHATILAYARGASPKFRVQREDEVAQSVLDRFGKYMDDEGRITFGALRAGNEAAELVKARSRFIAEHDREPTDADVAVQYTGGALIRDVWTDIPVVRENLRYREFQGIRTQKPEALLRRIIDAASAPGDVVLDCFAGSGTTAVAAQRLGRRWISCDINRGAVQVTAKRLQATIREQAEGGPLFRTDGDEPVPAQTAFTVWRVNDYDLQIQHNEAVNLACDLIGVERTRSDPYFDGALQGGRALVKVVPFNHPLTPLDLEEVKRELDARPEETRPITLISLGIEIAALGWIENWNRMRRGRNAANRIEVIELRTDERYGGVIRHEPAAAKVKVRRERGRLHVEIEDFVSPTIIQRLEQQAGVLKPQIDDWRAMVDSVAIDPAYDDEVFNVVLADVPEKKSDLVSGSYDLEAPQGETTVAVRIIDMLGEEVLHTEPV